MVLGLLLVVVTLLVPRDERREARPGLVVAKSRGMHRMAGGQEVTRQEGEQIRRHNEELVARPAAERAISQPSLVARLARVAALPPPTPPSPSCSPPSPPPVPSCMGHTGLLGPRRARPRKMVMMILFGFEVDIMEIMLRDSLDLLDRLFVVEAEDTHKGVRACTLL